MLSALLFQHTHSFATYTSLVPVVLGVCLATYGDVQFTAAGLALTLLGALLAAFKSLVTHRLLVGRLKFHPLELGSPLSIIRNGFILSWC